MKQQALMIEEAIRLGYGRLSDTGALVVETGRYTGRATQERFVVRRPETEKRVHWGGANQPIDQEFAGQFFDQLERKLSLQKASYFFQGNIGGLPIEVKSTSPWHIAFAENMFRSDTIPQFLKGLDTYGTIRIFHDPDGNSSDYGRSFPTKALIILDPVARKVGIVGTAYAGEIKKSAFSTCNFSLPDFEILPMHASANCLKNGTDTCVLFGLSGTGKTTLSASPDRYLIGDDEILWTKRGISNLEAGCYAKLIDLYEMKEPEIYRAIHRFGSVVENVPFHENTRKLDLISRSITENTRGSYSLSSFEKVFDQSQEASPPKTVVFLTADAFGALPIVARLNPWQAQYHFISGYTAKVAGTEIGVKEPKSVFSACFGEPFMPRHPEVYARLLNDLATRNDTSFWLLNTGWTQGGYGQGERVPLQLTRQILSKIQSGEMSRQPMREHPIFGFLTPTSCPGVDEKWLAVPQGPQVLRIAHEFVKNMSRFPETDQRILEQGGPRLEALAA